MNKIIKYSIFMALLLLMLQSHAQAPDIIKGTVLQYNNSKLEAVPYANVFWLETQKGTSTDEKGNFTIEKPGKNPSHLVVSFVGYKNDTIIITTDKKEIRIILTNNTELSEVTITGGMEGSYISRLKPIKTEVITQAGLNKMACCNLSESFENSATVDVGYSDAVSGAKQIQMLGLAGIYSQLMWENIPFLRGLSSSYGLSYVPGSWMESIQISKGTSSVINGYESVTGQINVEYKKPQTAKPFFLNYYISSELKNELNVFSTHKINKNLSTMLMGHGSFMGTKWDENNDGFMDQPKLNQINLFNRWAYEGNGYHSILGFNFVNENRDGGQMDYDENIHRNDTVKYGIGIKNQRFQLFTKNGFEVKGMDETSIGIQAAATYHKQDVYFGLATYSGTQKSLYLNAIFQSELSHLHKYSFGFSYQYDNYEESYNKLKANKTFDTSYNRPRVESVPGVFAQYTFEIHEKLTVIAGIRADFNSYYRTFVTPRLHVKWNITKSATLRASAGKGYRSASVFSENMGFMASSRTVMIVDELDLEEAWNYGINLSKCWEFKENRKATFTIDFYRTDFINQVVVDIDHSMHHVDFYNLGFNNTGGKSYSNSLQAEFNIDAFKRFNVGVAARINDVKVDYLKGTMEKPYVSKYKGLLTMSYATKYEKWMFDFTLQLNGKSRLPNMIMSPATPVYDNYSPAYAFLLGQVTRKFRNFDIYIGSENISDYMQHDPIMGASKPFSNAFDASMIWGPIMGRMFYGGIRLTI
jgi:hypothetical protein